MTKLTPESPMPFGKKFYGNKMKNVPSSYLLWVYANVPNIREDLKMYIEENKHILEMESKSTKYFRR